MDRLKVVKGVSVIFVKKFLRLLSLLPVFHLDFEGELGADVDILVNITDWRNVHSPHGCHVQIEVVEAVPGLPASHVGHVLN